MHVSPSQISAFRRCELRWWWQTIAGFKAPETKSQRLGKEIHAELEAYLKGGPTPKNPIALAGINRLPSPADVDPLDVEFGFLLDIGPVPFFGFIDLREPKRGRITDHKTTSDFGYMKTSVELFHDPQAVVYGVVGHTPRILEGPVEYAGQENVYKVAPCFSARQEFRHVYYRTREAPRAEESGVVLHPGDLESNFRAVLKTVYRMEEAASLTSPTQVRTNLSACDDYGGCPHRVRCANIGHPVMGSMSGVFNLKPQVQGEQKMAMSPLALLASRKATQSPNAVTEALNRIQSMTPEQHAEKVAGNEAELRVMAAFASTDTVTQASLPPEFSALFGRGLLKLDGDAATLTDIGIQVRQILLRGGLKPAVPSVKDRLHLLSPRLTKAYNEGASVVSEIVSEIQTVLAESDDGSVTAATREVFVGMVSDAQGWLARQVPKDVQIDFDSLEPIFLESEAGDGTTVSTFWMEKTGRILDKEPVTGQMGMEDGKAYLFESGVVLVRSATLAGLFGTQAQKVEILLKKGAGSSINPPDGVGEDAPDDEVAPVKKSEGLILPDGRDAKKLPKKDLGEAHLKLFEDVLEGHPAIKIYKTVTNLPEKGKTIERYLEDVALILKLRDGIEKGLDLEGLKALVAPAPAAAPAVAPAVAPAAAPAAPLVLYIDCRPMRRGIVDLADFLRPFEDAVAEESQLPDYLGKPFKDGQKAVVSKLAIARNRGELNFPDAIYCPKTHPAFSEATGWLTRFATEIVRPCY